MPSAELCASPVDTSTTFSILKLRILFSYTYSIRLITLWQSTFLNDAWLDLGFLTSFSWQSVVNQLRASERNWLFYQYQHECEKRKSKFSALSFMTLCSVGECGQSHMQMNGRKLVLYSIVAMQLETDIGSDFN